jgi:hypothetical protein
MRNPPGDKTRLTSWKEVAAFLGTTPRTAMRWESERGLPIRRLPGESRSRIHADVAELRAWLTAKPPREAEPQAAPAEAAPAAAGRIRRNGVSAGLYFTAIVSTAVVAAAIWLSAHGARSHTLAPAARGDYETAIANFDRRTPTSLAAAVDDFTKVSQIDPTASEGFAGLALTYDIMPEYTAMNSAQAYGLAEANARRAIVLNEADARAHAAYAFARFYGSLDLKTAQREFARAVELSGDDALTRHWFATFLLSTGDVRRALSEIDRAHALDPASRSIAADRGLILADNGRRQEAIAVLNRLVQENAAFCSPHEYLSFIAFDSGDDETFVRESRSPPICAATSIPGGWPKRRRADAGRAAMRECSGPC